MYLCRAALIVIMGLLACENLRRFLQFSLVPMTTLDREARRYQSIAERLPPPAAERLLAVRRSRNQAAIARELEYVQAESCLQSLLGRASPLYLDQDGYVSIS